MTDIIERLKSGVGSNLNDEAADTIESLRARVAFLEKALNKYSEDEMLCNSGFSAGDMADQGAKAFREGQGTTRPKGMMLVSVDLLRDVENALGSFCSDEGWGAEDMQTMDNVSAVLAAAPKP